jgi:alpha-1,2-mannosyltransferase
VAEVVLALAAVAAVVAWIVCAVNAQGWDMLDLTIYQGAGRAIRSGEPLYSWKYQNWLPFTYTPFAGLLFAAVADVSPSVSRVGSVLLDGVALTVTVWAVLQSVRVGRPWHRIAGALVLSFAAIGLEPVSSTISFGQVNLLLMALVVPDLLLGDGRRWQGIGVGLATAIKITPAIFIPYLLLTRRPASAIRALATFAATIVLSYLVLPDDTRTFWVDRVFLDASRTGNVGYLGNQSLNGAITRWTGSGFLPLLVLVALWGMAVAVMVHRRGHPQLGLIVVALTGLLASPVSWTHHWVWAVPAVAYLLVAPGWRLWQRLLSAVAVAALFVAPGWVWKMPAGDNREYSADTLTKLASDLYSIVGIVVLAGLTAWLLIGDRPAAGDPLASPDRDATDQADAAPVAGAAAGVAVTR